MPPCLAAGAIGHGNGAGRPRATAEPADRPRRSDRLPAPMARRSLRPHLNQIRTWVRQGRTDAWIAHQLEVTVQQIEAFKRENELLPDGEAPEGPAADFDDEIDLRAEDDALIAAELEAAEAARGLRARPRRPAGPRRRPREGRGGRARRRAGEDDDRGRGRGRGRGRPSRGAAGAAAAAGAARPARRRARGHLRPRRGGLRALARPRRRRRPRLRRALGRPPARRGHGRGGPDRHPARRRGRRRRRRRRRRPRARARLRAPPPARRRRARRHPLGGGWRDSRFPAVWSMNALRVGAEATPTQLEAVLDEPSAERPHRRLVCEAARTPPAHGPGRAAPLAGRAPGGHGAARAARPPARPRPGPRGRRGHAAGRRGATMLDAPDARDAEAVRRVVAARALAPATPTRRFLRRLGGPRRVQTTLYSDGRAAQVETSRPCPSCAGAAWRARRSAWRWTRRSPRATSSCSSSPTTTTGPRSSTRSSASPGRAGADVPAAGLPGFASPFRLRGARRAA